MYRDTKLLLRIVAVLLALLIGGLLFSRYVLSNTGRAISVPSGMVQEIAMPGPRWLDAAAQPQEELRQSGDTPAVVASVPRGPKSLSLQIEGVSAAGLYEAIAKSGPSLDNADDVSMFARIMEKCWAVDSYQRMAHLISPQADAKAHGAAQALAQAEREANAASCGGLPADAFSKADEWTAALAAMGVPRSMYDYVTRSFWVRDPMNSLKEPSRLIDYRKNSLGYLDNLIDDGYPEALVAMGSIKLNPTWGEPDRVAAWAYMRAAAKAMGNVEIEAKLLAGIDSRVPAEKREEAIAMSETLMRKCCAK